MKLTPEQRQTIMAALLKARGEFEGNDIAFTKPFGIRPGAIELLKKGTPVDKVLNDEQLANIGYMLQLAKTRRWNTVKTEVFRVIEGDVRECQQEAKSIMLCDDCGIGKSYTAKYLSKTMDNVFYVDCSQCRHKSQFVKNIARAIGVDVKGTQEQVVDRIKYTLQLTDKPCIILDEAGDLEDSAVLFVKELWNATEYNCGWYMMGADGLRKRMEKNITINKVGWIELFSRFNDRYTRVVPETKDEKRAFYHSLISDVLSANMADGEKVYLNEIVNKCLTNDSGRITGLRRAETLLRLKRKAA